MDAQSGRKGLFPTTRWGRILAAQDRPEQRQALMSELFQWYWRPLYLYARYKGLTASSAEDAVQGLFVHLLERDVVARLDPAKGRLRSYLRTAMNHYLADLHAKATASKRGGGAVIESLDTEHAERIFAASPIAGSDAMPDEMFDRAWAQVVMERALAALEREFATGQRPGRFELVQAYFRAEEPPSYRELAAQHEMTIPALKSFLHRARLRFRALVREQVSDTVPDSDTAAVELQTLSALLGR